MRPAHCSSAPAKLAAVGEISNGTYDPVPFEPGDGRKLGRGRALLNRWARARSVRSTLHLDRPPLADRPAAPPAAASEAQPAEEDEAPSGPKAIYMVSDGTGSTLEHALGSALGQFEKFLARRDCGCNTRLFSGIEDIGQLLFIIKQAAKEGALLLYTLANPLISEPVKQACELWHVPYIDILGPTINAISVHFGVAPSGIPRPDRKTQHSDDLFQREAIEFTIRQDDGAQPQNLYQADIVLLGVSRAGKTPLSIYLAQKGYKVANVPIVVGVDLPKTISLINQDKIFGLSINPAALQKIRRSRAVSLGFDTDLGDSYSDINNIRLELEFASRLYAQNPLWTVIDATGKATEELAAIVLRIYNDKRQKRQMPHISMRY